MEKVGKGILESWEGGEVGKGWLEGGEGGEGGKGVLGRWRR